MKRWLLRAVLIAAACWAGWLTWKHLLRPWLFPPSPLVLTPQLALESLTAKTLYFNGIARPWLLERRADLLTEEDRDEKSPRSRAFLQATQNPKLFRQLDRQHRFDTLLLIGDPSNYRRLLEHLIEPEPDKRDFRLVYLDHWALVFKRNAPREWQPADAEPLRVRIAKLRSEDRAAFHALAAAKMLALRKIEAAREWLDHALAADSTSLDALAGQASYFVALGKWTEAGAYADRALAMDENSIPAIAVKVLTMRATDYKTEALKWSEKLNTLLPEDPVRLWQHAQIAHEAQDYKREIAALTRLIELAAQEDRPAGDYHFQLGEAHVFEAINDATHAPLALAALRKALADPALAPEKRKFAQERIATIRERAGLK